LAKKYADRGFLVVAPSLDAEAGVKKFKEKHNITEYPLLSDAGASAQAYGVKAFPTMFLVGTDGKVLWKDHFQNEAMIKALESALPKK
jgi:peroxiredoxin